MLQAYKIHLKQAEHSSHTHYTHTDTSTDLFPVAKAQALSSMLKRKGLIPVCNLQMLPSGCHVIGILNYAPNQANCTLEAFADIELVMKILQGVH